MIKLFKKSWGMMLTAITLPAVAAGINLPTVYINQTATAIAIYHQCRFETATCSNQVILLEPGNRKATDGEHEINNLTSGPQGIQQVHQYANGSTQVSGYPAEFFGYPHKVCVDVVTANNKTTLTYRDCD